MPRLTQVDAMSLRSICSLLMASSQAPMASAFQRASRAAESIFRKVVALAACQHCSPEPLPTTCKVWAKAAPEMQSGPAAARTAMADHPIRPMARPPFDQNPLIPPQRTPLHGFAAGARAVLTARPPGPTPRPKKTAGGGDPRPLFCDYRQAAQGDSANDRQAHAWRDG